MFCPLGPYSTRKLSCTLGTSAVTRTDRVAPLGTGAGKPLTTTVLVAVWFTVGTGVLLVNVATAPGLPWAVRVMRRPLGAHTGSGLSTLAATVGAGLHDWAKAPVPFISSASNRKKPTRQVLMESRCFIADKKDEAPKVLAHLIE